MNELDHPATRDAANIADRLALLGLMKQQTARQGDGAWVATKRLDISTDDDGGGVVVPPEHVIPAELVPRVGEEDRRWVTLDEIEREIRELNVRARGIVERGDGDEHYLGVLHDTTKYAAKYGGSSFAGMARSRPLGIVHGATVARRGTSRARRGRRTLVGAGRAKARSDDGPLPPKPPLGGLLRALVRLLWGRR